MFGNEFQDSESEILQSLSEKFPNLTSIFLEGNEPTIDSNAPDYVSKLKTMLPKLTSIDNKLIQC